MTRKRYMKLVMSEFNSEREFAEFLVRNKPFGMSYAEYWEYGHETDEDDIDWF